MLRYSSSKEVFIYAKWEGHRGIYSGLFYKVAAGWGKVHPQNYPVADYKNI
jgi:hypothetical protein